MDDSFSGPNSPILPKAQSPALRSFMKATLTTFTNEKNGTFGPLTDTHRHGGQCGCLGLSLVSSRMSTGQKHCKTVCMDLHGDPPALCSHIAQHVVL